MGINIEGYVGYVDMYVNKVTTVINISLLSLPRRYVRILNGFAYGP